MKSIVEEKMTSIFVSMVPMELAIYRMAKFQMSRIIKYMLYRIMLFDQFLVLYPIARHQTVNSRPMNGISTLRVLLQL